MSKRLFVCVAALLAAGCGRGSSGVTEFDVKTVFGDKQPIPTQYSCDGANASPPVEWSGAPGDTKSYAVFIDDTSLPKNVFSHWAAYNIPASVHSLAANAGAEGNQQLAQAINGTGKRGYFGPCPPHGGNPHTYNLKVLALNVDKLDVPPNPTAAQVEAVAETHKIGRAEMTGTFWRK
jgi:Raf kinase inhibitor-like YbhB/YbcL family protein